MTRNARKMQEKARKCTITKDYGKGLFKVASPSGSEYTVDIERNRCNCKWAKYNPGKACSHLIAARNEWEKFNTNRTVSVWDTKEDAKRQHRYLCIAQCYIPHGNLRQLTG